jgi:excisionase family DNA binding protein
MTTHSVGKSHGLETQLTITEVAEITGTSDSTVRRWIARGELRAYYFGPRAIRIDPADLRAMRKEVNPTTFEHVNGGGAK